MMEVAPAASPEPLPKEKEVTPPPPPPPRPRDPQACRVILMKLDKTEIERQTGMSDAKQLPIQLTDKLTEAEMMPLIGRGDIYTIEDIKRLLFVFKEEINSRHSPTLDTVRGKIGSGVLATVVRYKKGGAIRRNDLLTEKQIQDKIKNICTYMKVHCPNKSVPDDIP
jgi:hypothetical protein